MKNNLLKAFIAIFLCGSTLFASANDVYLSATGNDSNDGTAAATAYATLGKAIASVSDGGIIYVSGFIYVCDDPTNLPPDGEYYGNGLAIAKNVKIQGSNKKTDGFLGFNESTYGLSRIFRVNANGVLTLNSLTLRDGLAFNKGGAIHVNGGAVVAENVNFEDCTAEGVEQPAGGAIMVDKSTGLSFKNCLFKNNKAEKGGALYMQDTDNTSAETRFEACSFVNNEASARGGGALFFRIMAEGNKINIINSTLSTNRTSGNGGVISIYNTPASTTFNIINTTIVNNLGLSGGGSGGGILVGENDKGVNLRIQNSIIEGNTVASGATSEDLTYFTSYDPATEQLQISNSYIGNVYVSGARTINPVCYENSTLYWNYLPRTYDALSLASGIDNLNTERNVHPLKAGSSALTYGNATYLQAISINTDALGQVRAFADGKCSVGAVEGVGIPSGIQALDAPAGIAVYQKDNQLVVKTVASGNIQLQLYSISGQKVLQQSTIGSELTVTTSALQGIYIAKVLVDGHSYVQKVVIK
ncbi:MAG: hypothetical protein EZS26_000260 [Candidatus Ordinivivax streblomastigis]|uniref:Secretion system C-terminal sorting domain-containing protein n=1 Tax=Candidatus Ordinivivax streblomastigis TaxID=2540710 RepID=A0A5M8P5B5_9BACT|nr:MAG: hypothetical protein EZS26_000260 [Candidatus Ordinivivax streblomastigis]